MKRLLATIGFMAALSCTAQALTIDFNNLSAGYYTESSFNALFTGVSYDNTGGDGFGIQYVRSLQPDFSGNVIINSNYAARGNTTVARFSSATNEVSVTMGDSASDRDSLYLYAYDANNNLVGSDSFDNPIYSYQGYTLRVASSLFNIAWVEFYGVGINANSVFWDNFTFNEVPVTHDNPAAPVPEPATLMLLGSGLIGFAGIRMKRSK